MTINISDQVPCSRRRGLASPAEPCHQSDSGACHQVTLEHQQLCVLVLLAEPRELDKVGSLPDPHLKVSRIPHLVSVKGIQALLGPPKGFSGLPLAASLDQVAEPVISHGRG